MLRHPSSSSTPLPTIGRKLVGRRSKMPEMVLALVLPNADHPRSPLLRVIDAETRVRRLQEARLMNPSERGPTVLVVDNDPGNLVAIGAVLEPLDCNVVSVQSGAEAVERTRSED